MPEGALTCQKGERNSVAPAAAEGCPSPSWEPADTPAGPDGPAREEVAQRPCSPSPQAAFQWHPAHLNTAKAYWEAGSCPTEPNGE